MSKSLGNGVDPLDLIATHGADATRYGLLKMSSTQDVRFAEGPLEEGRKLANKLWNVSRLLLQERVEPEARPRELEERWILARLDATRAEVEAGLERVRVLALRPGALPPHLRRLLRLVRRGDQAAARRAPRRGATALAALEQLLKLLHPVMPHVTEEIWSQFHDDRLIVAPWPEATGEYAADLHALDAVQEAAAIFRRSGVAVPLEGDEKRIFAAVVRPGAVEGERERRGRDRAPAQRDRAGRAHAREREVRRERQARGGRGRARQARPLPA